MDSELDLTAFSNCDCVLKADGATDRKSFPSCNCYDGKLWNRPCKMRNQISISARIGIALEIQA